MMATTGSDNSVSRVTGIQAPDGPRSHRLLLANLDRYTDSSSDHDDTSDDDASSQNYLKDDDDPDHLVGVSMGKAQTRLKSARTPAYEKAKALEESGHYFASESEQIEREDDDDDDSHDISGYLRKHESPTRHELSTAEVDGPSIIVAPDNVLSPQGSASTSQRSSISKVFGSQGSIKTRRRASSGPTALFNSIKKILPDLSSPLASRFASASPSGPAAESATSQQDKPRSSSLCPRKRVDDSIKDNYERSPQSTTIDDSQKFEPELAETDSSSTDDKAAGRPPLLSRTTSDNSLYLRRAITGASDFDDTTVYADVADMPNARFKAITDSLQDSAIRLPRLPGTLLGGARMSIAQTDSNITNQNTEANRGIPRSATIELSKREGIPGSHPSPVRKESKHPVLKEALSRTTGDMVILGGYRGSILRSAEPPHHQVWIPVKVGLNLRKVDLEVGLDHADEERMTERIIPSGILSHIGPIDISRRLLGKIRRCHNVKTNQLRLHDWGYDWRLSPHRLAKQLISFLESLECNKPGTPPDERGALVVAHSLGGLITRHAVNQRPELFKGVVYAGVPQNCVNILGPLRNGDDVLISSRVLTAQVNFTLRTSYALLPEDGRCFINKETGERYDFDFFDIKTWEEYHLSPCINPPLAPFVPIKRKSLVGSISESISSFTPSLPTRKGSWLLFGNSSNSSEPSPTTAEPQQKQHESLQEKATNVKDRLEDTVNIAAERLPNSPKRAINSTLEPSMKPSSATSSGLSPSLSRNKAEEEEGGGNGSASSDLGLSPSISSSSSTATATTPTTASTTTSSSNRTTTPPTSATPTPTSSWSTTSTPKAPTTIATNVTIPQAKAHEYLKRTLHEVKAFKSELTHRPSHEKSNAYPPFAVIYGRSVPTVYGAKVVSKEAIRHADAYDDLAFASGDGVVLASAAQLPIGYRCVRGGRVLSERGHVGLLGDLEGVGQCIGAVVEGRRRGIGLGLGLD